MKRILTTLAALSVAGSGAFAQVANNDVSATIEARSTVNFSLLSNDTGDIDPNTVNLIPAGLPSPATTNPVTDGDGDLIGFDVPTEGAWLYDPATGRITFTPDPNFIGEPTRISYTVRDLLGTPSNTAFAEVSYSAIPFSPAVCGDNTGLVFTALSFRTMSPVGVRVRNYTFANAGIVNGTPVDVLLEFSAVPDPGRGDPPRVVPDGRFGFQHSNSRPDLGWTWTVVERGTTTPVTGNYNFSQGDLDIGERSTYLDVDLQDVTLNAPTNLMAIVEGSNIRFQGATGARSSVPEDTLSISLTNRSSWSGFTRTGSSNGGAGFSGTGRLEPPNATCQGAPNLLVEKVAGVQGPVDPTTGLFTQEFTVNLQNNSTIAIDDPTLLDDIETVFGDLFDPSTTANTASGVVGAPTITPGAGFSGTLPVANPDFDGDADTRLVTGSSGQLLTGDSFSVTFTILLDASDGQGSFVNTVVANGTPQSGDLLEQSAQAPVTIPELITELGLLKSSTFNDIDGVAGASVGDTITFDYIATNNGNINLQNVTVIEPRAAPNEFTGTGATPMPIDATLTAGSTVSTDTVLADAFISSLAPGESAEWSAVYEITQADINAGGVTNSAVVRGEDLIGGLVSDSSDDDNDGTGVADTTEDDPTFTPLTAPSIELIESIAGVEDTNGNGVFGDAGDTVTYVYTAQNVGNTSLAGVGIAPGDEGFAVSLEGSSVFTPDPSFDLQSGTGGVLAIGSDPVVIGTATYVIAPSDVAAGQIVTQPTVTSTAVATGAGNVPLPGTPLVDAGGAALPPVTDVSDTGTGSNLDRADGSVPNIAEPGTSGTGNDPTVLLLQSTGEFLLTKSAGTERVLIGETVTYEIVATSLMASDFAPTQIVDTLPAGLVFTPGSATIDGVAVEAVVSGQTITFSDLTMPANGSLTIGLQARVLSSAPAGALTNVVDLLDQLTGDALAQTASATVTRTVESVFDCSPVIGKVFDDVNMNGYQDEAPARGAIISDQDIFVDKLGNGGKLSSANVVPQAEVGMPGVRLVTPSGTIITTDANGLYSVPCAEIPSGIGSNFMLKLDTRTLPTGYRMTTENPRVMRLTSGIMTEMNFGAAIGRVFDVDLSGRAYAGDQIAPSAALVDGLNGVLRQIADTPTVVRISYYRNQETAELARDRLNAIEDLIEARWADIGTYRLLIEKSVNQLQ